MFCLQEDEADQNSCRRRVEGYKRKKHIFRLKKYADIDERAARVGRV